MYVASFGTHSNQLSNGHHKSICYSFHANTQIEQRLGHILCPYQEGAYRASLARDHNATGAFHGEFSVSRSTGILSHRSSMCVHVHITMHIKLTVTR